MVEVAHESLQPVEDIAEAKKDAVQTHSERLDEPSLRKCELDMLKQLLRNANHLQEKISRIDEEMEN